MNDGLLDTNIIIHARSGDEHSLECREFLRQLHGGRIQVQVDSLIVHELTYALPRYVKQLGRKDVAAYLISIIEWPGVIANKALLVEALTRWGNTPGLGFVDAYLATRARIEDRPVYTKNVRELASCGAVVPDPLLSQIY
jgi:predicted nucleic acid-binding protein